MGTTIKTEYTAPHYNTRLFRANYLYINRYHGPLLFDEICNELGIDPEYLKQDDNWVSDFLLAKFMELLITKTGDNEIAEKMGAFTVTPYAANPIEFLASQTIVPLIVFLGSPIQYGRFNNLNTIKIANWRPGYFEYIVAPKGTQKCHPEVCKNTMGVWRGSQKLFGLDKVEVTHPRCVHRGDADCFFTVAYSARAFWRKRLTTITIAFVIFFLQAELTKGLFPNASNNPLAFWMLFLGWNILGITTFFSMKYVQILRHIDQYNEQSKLKSTELYKNYQKLDRKYHESNLLRSLSLKLSQTVNPTEVIESCLEEMQTRFGFGRSIVMLLSSERNRIYTAAVRGFEQGTEKIYQVSLKYPAEKNEPHLFANILESGKPELIEDIETYKDKLKPHNRALLENLNVTSIIACPIQDEKDKFGLLIVGSIGEDRKLSDDDLNMMTNICQLLTLSFHTARGYENESSLRKLFQKYVPALVLNNLSTLSTDMQPRTVPITSLMIDLRDFTSRSETLPPERTVELLNLYTNYVTTHIAGAGGIVDKLVGDGVVAFFPGKVGDSSHAVDAFACAKALLTNLPELQSVFSLRGFGEVAIGIGLCSGNATVGNMGCDRKLDFTAIGDTVNLAARLQERTKEYRNLTPSSPKGLALISESTARLLPTQKWTTHYENVVIRGRAKPETIYLLDIDTALIEDQPRYKAA